MKAGIQVSSFKPVLTTDEQVKSAFETLRVMGCKWVQLQWIDPSVSIEHIAECLKQSGIQSVSVQDFYEVVLQNPDYYIRLNAVTGGRWMCVSRIPERLKTPQGLDEYIAELRSMQKMLDHYGQQLCFHAVAADFSPIEGIAPVDYLLEHMPELALCADLYHVRKVGLDINEWLRHWQGRICMVHFKDSMYTGEKEQLVPVGQGDTDWTDVVATCLETGVEYAFAEQERWDRDPFVCLREAFDWIIHQGGSYED